MMRLRLRPTREGVAPARRVHGWLALLCALGSWPTLSAAQPGRPARLVVLGDSLSAGFLLPRSEAFPTVLEQALRQRGYSVLVIDAAVSGDTASGGLARLDRDVPEGTDGVVLQLGANDRLRRVDPEVTRGALETIVARLRARGIAVLFAGIRFSNRGDSQVAQFNAVFPAVARRYGLVHYPDIYAGLSADPRLTIFDGVHPSPDGVRRMVQGILPTVERFVKMLPGRTDVRARRSN